MHLSLLLPTYPSLKTNYIYVGVVSENQLKPFFSVLILTLIMLDFLKIVFSGGQFESPFLFQQRTNPIIIKLCTFVKQPISSKLKLKNW